MKVVGEQRGGGRRLGVSSRINYKGYNTNPLTKSCRRSQVQRRRYLPLARPLAPTFMVAPTTTPSMAPAAVSSLQRQLGSLQVVVSELSVTEDARQTRLKTCPPKGRKALQKRFAFERKLDVDRVTRMKEEADQMRVLAEKGSWNGTVRNLTDTRPPPQVGNVEVKGLEARGGLTDNQYKFLKEVYTKFEEPQKPKVRHTKLSTLSARTHTVSHTA